MKHHRDALARLSRRGTPRGAGAVWHAATRDTAAEAGLAGASRVVTASRRTSRRARPALAVIAFAAVVSLGGLAIMVLRSDDPAGGDPTTPGAATTTSSEPDPGDSLGLVPRSEWPEPALDPVLSLPACGDPAPLSSFMAEEFPEAEEHDHQSETPETVASTIAMPRVGHLSLFTWDDLDGACLETGRRGDILGWWIGDASGGFVARAAARDVEIREVPPEASQGPYHQAWIATAQGFSGSVYPSGRAQVAIAFRYTVLEAPGRLPGDDLHLEGEWLAASIALRHVVLDGGIGRGRRTLPNQAPLGYGVCLLDPLFLSRSSLEIVLCTADGDYIEIHRSEPHTVRPPHPTDATTTAVGVVDGLRWSEDGRQTVTVVLETSHGSTFALWATGPIDLPAGTLEAVLASTVPLSRQVLAPRSVTAGPVSIDDDRLGQAIEVAGASEITSQVLEWAGSEPGTPSRLAFEFALDSAVSGDILISSIPHALPGDRASFAYDVGVTSVAAIGPIDALLVESDRLQAVFFCNGTALNATFFDTTYRDSSPPRFDLGWARVSEHRQRIFDFLDRLVDALGCRP